MSLTVPQGMAQPSGDPFTLAGSGGVVLGEARTSHEGRNAVLLVRGQADTRELEDLAATMGISIVETVVQAGREDPRTYLGKGRLLDIADELQSRVPGHPWAKVDLVLVHTNATARQLVGISSVIGLEIWDRVRLLLSLFTAHAASVEARTQVRIARLQSDRTVLRELANQQTTGERAGYGGGGVTALQNVIANLNRELTNLRKRQRKHHNAQREHRRQRARSGAMTVGFVGYTNAGKSSLFQRLSGKQVLVQDKLFSTLETTVGRMEKSPRILLVDTIGFIDNIPNATLAAFKATIGEAIDADLTLLLVDASDPFLEIRRKVETTRREITERQGLDEEGLSDLLPPCLVLTKADNVSPTHLAAVKDIVHEFGFTEPLVISTHENTGLDALQLRVREHLFGAPSTVLVKAPQAPDDDASERIVADIHEAGMVEDHEVLSDGTVRLVVWAAEEQQARLTRRWAGRIDIK
ncbi:MAG: GTPase [Poseidonia sp.]